MKFTEIKTTPTGLTFKAKLPELAPHAGPILPNIHATLTDKVTGKEVSKSSVVLEGLSEELKNQTLNSPLYYSNILHYSNLLEGTIFEPSLTPGNYVLTVEGTTGPTYGQNTDKRKRHFVFSTEVTLTGEGNSTTTTQPEKPKDSTTEPKSDQTTNNNQQPSNDQNKQSTNNNTGKQDKNELSTNKIVIRRQANKILIIHYHKKNNKLPALLLNQKTIKILYQIQVNQHLFLVLSVPSFQYWFRIYRKNVSVGKVSKRL